MLLFCEFVTLKYFMQIAIKHATLTAYVIFLLSSHDFRSNSTFSHGVNAHTTVDVGNPNISQCTSANSFGLTEIPCILICGFSKNFIKI